MKGFRNLAAGLAVFSVLATPATAGEWGASTGRSAYAQSAYDTAQDKAEGHRRWRYRDRVDAGDVIAGIAILGGIAAIASAVDRDGGRDRYEDRRYDRRYDERRYRTDTLDRAVNACTREIERDIRVDGVDSVNRLGEGWEVRGRLYNGGGFTCLVSGEGRIDRIDYGRDFQGSAAPYDGAAATAPGQWADDTYAAARAGRDSAYGSPAEPDAQSDSAQPAYPGGPLPGEEIDGDIGV
ncbi:hypothetical protein WAB17_10190 [Parerythrobacter aurantius]|uniref:hypothetical protein n=1 Tax=Parerythrobacter aurantius TaxID=3127706 RepID=UPI00324B4395